MASELEKVLKQWFRQPAWTQNDLVNLSSLYQCLSRPTLLFRLRVIAHASTTFCLQNTLSEWMSRLLYEAAFQEVFDQPHGDEAATTEMLEAFETFVDTLKPLNLALQAPNLCKFTTNSTDYKSTEPKPTFYVREACILYRILVLAESNEINSDPKVPIISKLSQLLWQLMQPLTKGQSCNIKYQIKDECFSDFEKALITITNTTNLEQQKTLLISCLEKIRLVLYNEKTQVDYDKWKSAVKFDEIEPFLVT